MSEQEPKVSLIELECRKAFENEDGYGNYKTDKERYRIFRDGYYACYNKIVPRDIDDPRSIHLR